MSKAIFLLLAAFLLTGINAAGAETTGEMLSNCRPIADANIQSGTISYRPTLETQFCWGAFSLLQGLLRFVDKQGNPILSICTPQSARRSQYVAVFVDYAKKNPQRWHEEFDVVLMESIQEAFPCK